MTARVYWRPKGCAASVAFVELGQDDHGAWGLIEDAAWLAGAGCLELLYKSQADYGHAMRGLPAQEIALAVQHRRKVFWRRFEQESSSLMQDSIWDCIGSCGHDEAALKARGKLVSLHASFIHAQMRASQGPNEWLNDLIYHESALIAELESASLRPVDVARVAKEECATRRHFVEELGKLMVTRAGKKEFFWPYQEVQRTYAVNPVTPQLKSLFRREGEDNPRIKWRDSLLMPLFERDVDQIAKLGFHLQPVFATRGEFIAAKYLLTQAQFDVETQEKVASPDFQDWLQGLRISMASLREAARMRTRSDKSLNAILVRQIAVELPGLADWMNRPGASPSSSTLASTLEASIAFLKLLAAMFLARKDRSSAAEAKMIATRLGKMLEET